ncbi:MAG TPA: META domain-containing protein [Gaiellaceae bacterium]|nr:META domain-containing protein [Gaiellaceae bacterium]
MRSLLRACAAVLTLVAAGCGAPAGEEGGVAPEGAWTLVAAEGPDELGKAVEGHRITLVFEDGRVGGTAACNSYGGSLRLEGDRFEVGELVQTEMACEPPVMAAESAYLGALGEVERYRLGDEELVLLGPSLRLRFEREPPVPTEELVGTTWELDTLLAGEVASSPSAPAELRLEEDGSVTGTTGCRDLSGRYVVRGGEIVVTSLALAGEGCPAETVVQDEHVVAVLGDGFRAEVDGDRLTLAARDRELTLYRLGG